MNRADVWTLILAGGIFSIFVANIVIGAAGGQPFLSDVGEMLTLFAACISFIIAVLHQERLKSSQQSQTENDLKTETN